MNRSLHRVAMVSLGCSKNRIDAEIMLAALADAGFSVTPDTDDADIVIVNTCGFIEDAKKEAIDTILGFAREKELRPLKLIVTGCLAQRYIDQMRTELPEIDAAVTLGSNGDIVSICDRVLNDELFSTDAPCGGLPLSGRRMLSSPPYSAYIKIAEGCDNHCTYCAIPMIRGAFRSRTIEDIFSEAQTLVKNGAVELILIAQDTTRYGEDLYGTPQLSTLLERLSQIEGLCWIRLLYCYPDRINDELIRAVADNDKVVKYLDIPLQHCSASVLRRMNRFGDRDRLMSLIKRLRSEIPGIVIRTTLMVGFPGETEEDFAQLDEFVEEARFDRLGCFSFSREEGTPADRLDGQLDEEVKERRHEIIMLRQQRVSEELNKAYIGRTLKVLTEGFDPESGLWFGRSYAHAPEVDGLVYFKPRRVPKTGEFIDILIDSAQEYDLFGKEA